MKETLTLPWPPSVNGYRVPVIRRGRPSIITSQRGRDYKIMVRVALGFRFPKQRHTGRLRVTVELCPPTLKRFDIDNFNKALLDSLTAAGVWSDDSQVDDLRNIRGKKIKGGCAIVTIEEIEG